MSEVADVTDSVFKAATPLLAALKDPKVKSYFRSLVLSDQPSVQPDEAPATRSRSLVLTLTPPPPSDANATVHCMKRSCAAASPFGYIAAGSVIGLIWIPLSTLPR